MSTAAKVRPQSIKDGTKIRLKMASKIKYQKEHRDNIPHHNHGIQSNNCGRRKKTVLQVNINIGINAISQPPAALPSSISISGCLLFLWRET